MRWHRTLAAVATLCLVLGGAAGPAAAITQYLLDDGDPETAFGMSLNNDLLWLNVFEALPGAETVVSIELMWSHSGFTNGAGGPATVLLYDDPNDDGDPTDGVLLTSVLTTMEQKGTETLVSVPIPATVVSGFFMVAALVTDAPNGLLFPAAMDISAPQGRSYIGFGVDLDPSTLAGVNAVGTVGNPSTDANFVLRATAVPEPSTALLTLGGLAALGLRRLR